MQYVKRDDLEFAGFNGTLSDGKVVRSGVYQFVVRGARGVGEF